MQFVFLVIQCILLGLTLIVASENPTDSNAKADLSLVPRAEWGASKPQQPPSPLKVLPAAYAIIGHTVTPVCLAKSDCSRRLLSIQNYHMKTLGYDDIGYNFLVGGDGSAYEGRGWDVAGAHTRNYNAKSIGIALVGNFETDKPTEAQLEAARRLLELGASENKLAKDYKLIGHNQVSASQSPGKNVIDVIKTWEHWAEKP